MAKPCDALSMFGKKRTYLDYTASMPPSSAALRAHQDALRLMGNPSSAHEEGREAKSALEDARTRVARVLSVKADDIVFTAGATEANNSAITGVVRKAIREKNGGGVHVLYLPSAHASVISTIRALKSEGVEEEPLVVRNGEVAVDEIRLQLREETALVAMDLVCGETGIVWNTREVAQILKDRRIPFLVDASQAPLTELMERTRIAADLLVMDAQKMGGVRGTGVLVSSRTLPLAPLMHGGGQERSLRPGTENVAGAVAFATALEEVQNDRESNTKAWDAMRTGLMKEIRDISSLIINEGKKQSPRILNISLLGRDTDYLQALLDKEGYAVSTKSACESDSIDGSRTIMALTGDAERAKATLRVSWGPGTGARDLSRFARALRKAVAFLDTN